MRRMAIGEAQLAARYNRRGHTLIDHYTYALVSDGDLMEGVGAEATSLAGHLKLGKLTCLYDDNFVHLSAGTDITFTEDPRRASAPTAGTPYGWRMERSRNDRHCADTSAGGDRTTVADPDTHAYRLRLARADSYKAHGSPLGADDVRKTKKTLNWPTEPAFLVPDAALAHCRERSIAVQERGPIGTIA